MGGPRWEKLILALVGRALISKGLIQLLADGWGCAPSLLVVWPGMTQPWVYGLFCRVNDDLQKDSHQGVPSRIAAACGPIPAASPFQPLPPQQTL